MVVAAIHVQNAKVILWNGWGTGPTLIDGTFLFALHGKMFQADLTNQASHKTFQSKRFFSSLTNACGTKREGEFGILPISCVFANWNGQRLQQLW